MNYILVFASFLISKCTFSFKKFSETDWFFDNLQKDDATLGETFARMASFFFLSKIQSTSCFSPICCEMNLHLQMIQNIYGTKYTNLSSKQFLTLLKKVKGINSEVFDADNHVYMQKEKVQERIINSLTKYGIGIYDLNNLNEIQGNHKEYVISKTTRNIPLDPETDISSNSSVFFSAVSFTECWNEKFDHRNTIEDYFQLNKEKFIKREFMNHVDSLKYKKFDTNVGGIHMVVVPFLEKSSKGKPCRVMVYLIPDNLILKFADIWKGFFEHNELKRGLKHIIKSGKYKNINLYIPKVSNLTTNLDLNDFFFNILKISSFSSSRLCTHININEEGTEAITVLKTQFVDCFYLEPLSLKANLPYISFIYDFTIDRILFV